MQTRKRDSVAPALSVSGLSADAIRAFLREAAELSSFDAKYAAKILSTDGKTIEGVLAALSMFGYIEPAPDDPNWWRTTQAGSVVAGVSRAKPITRKTAERALADVVTRIKEVNLEPGFLYSVEQAVVFGAYLTNADRFKNVDIGVELQPKIADEAVLEARVKANALKAEAEGHRFKSFADRRNWGKDHVRQFLKGRSRAVALHDLTTAITAQPNRSVYQR